MRVTPWARPAAATITAVAAVTALHVYGSVHADQVIPAPVARAAAADGVVNVQVVLTLVPEQYNVTYLQDRGSLVGVHGRTADLLEVTSAGLRQIASQYWVASIAPYQP